MRRWVLAIAILAAALLLGAEAQAVQQGHQTERISGSAGDVLEDNPVGRLKVYVYDLPSKYNKKLLKKDPRCLNHMFAAEIFMHRFLLSSAVRTFNPEEADWFYTPVYTTCDLTPSGLPLPFKSPRMMRSAIELIATNWPYWNRSEGADHFFVTPHDFGACFHYQEEKAIGRGILPLLQRATLVQTFGQKNHVCLKDGSITIPPFAPPQKMQAHLIPADTPRSIFVYFRGLFYDTSNDPEGGYYARGARASVWENFKNNPLFDISTDHPPTYYEDMQRSVFCLCPLGWAPWSPRLVEAVVFGCIPVIIADDIVLPFADAIPWEEIGVFVAEEDVPKLDSILTSIPTDVILRKQRLLANPSMKQAMLFPQPAQAGDAFHQILNGLAPHRISPLCPRSSSAPLRSQEGGGRPLPRYYPAAPLPRKLAADTMLSARTAVASAASPASPWKAVGGGSKSGSCDGCRNYRESVRRRAATVRVHAAEPRRVQAVAIGTAAETEEAAADGAVDPYAEDEEVPVMPWAYSVASGYTLLRDPQHNKGLAFTEKERDAHYLRGLLPPAVVSQEIQIKKFMHNLRQYPLPLQRYMSMMDLQERNERLFYRLLIDNVEELLPFVYTPTVGEACQKYGSIFRQPQGLYVSLRDKGRVLEVLRNWPQRDIQVICVTDGGRILGLGDLGAQGMGIPVGKLALYTALGGVRPSACLPVTIDVGTNNEALLNDEFYIGLRQKRATGQEYNDLIEEFMSAVVQIYGEKVLIQFEDFANHNAFTLLEKYSKSHLVFNDDIQGTASVVLAGLLASLKVVGGTLAEHTYLFLGAGEAGTGIAELIALQISKETKAPIEECRQKVWLVDSQGLIVSSRKDSLPHHKQPWAHEHQPVKTLFDAVQSIKPTVLVGTSGQGRAFTQEVVEAMASFNERPVIFSLSNPTSCSECTAEQAYNWTEGRVVFASGSPFSPVEYDGKTFVPGQANNAYIFPGLGLGLIMAGATRVHEDMLLAASEALADQANEDNFSKGSIFPPLSGIRKISAYIAAAVAAKAYELGLATHLPAPKDLVQYAESCMYNPVYRNYR